MNAILPGEWVEIKCMKVIVNDIIFILIRPFTKLACFVNGNTVILEGTTAMKMFYHMLQHNRATIFPLFFSIIYMLTEV